MYESPVGRLVLAQRDGELTGVLYERYRRRPDPTTLGARDDAAFAAVIEQLDAYFAGTLTEFDVPLASQGTPFQSSVWSALLEIPYGATESYAGVARRIGRASAVRAVGAANGRNPISIIVPCHRVVGADGGLTGYGGGVDAKRTLLELEARTAGDVPMLPYGEGSAAQPAGLVDRPADQHADRR